MLISVHIPKCAGTSFRLILAELYGESLWANYGQIFVRSQAREGVVPAGIQCIHGHFFADAFDDLLPERRLITWLRHPVERVVSNYYHFLRSPDMRDDCCRLLYERRLSLREFAELDWMKNEASRYLAGKSLDEFEFVGVAERFLESLQLFEEKIGCVLPLAPRYENCNPERRALRYTIDPADYDFILQLNETDLKQYCAAVARLESEVGTHAQAFAAA